MDAKVHLLDHYTVHLDTSGCVKSQGAGMTKALWVALGLAGQVIFSGRFLLQWLYSERQHRSAMPMGFWYASIVGSVMLLGFAIYKRDPVFMAGYGGGLLIYLRNLQLRWREAKVAARERS